MSTRVLTFWHYYDIVCAYSHMGGVSTNKIYHLRVIAPKKGGGSLEMRTLISILVIVAFSLLCSSAVVANRPAMQKALEGFIPNSSSEQWNEANAAQWRRWSRSPARDNFLPMSHHQGVAARGWFVDGDIFINKTSTGAYPHLIITR